MTSHLSRRTFLAGAAGVTLSMAITGARAQGSLRIATSMPILQDIVANIAGDAADVFSILPANTDPHTWEPTPADMVRLTEADAFIFNGADLEPFVETGGWRDAVSSNDIPEFQVTDHVRLFPTNEDDHDHENEEHDGDHDDDHDDHDDHEYEEHDGHDHTGEDPHIWLDPLTIVQAVPVIGQFLGELDADNATTFSANAETYVTELQDLHVEMEETLGVIPHDRRKLLVFHDAWRYFAARYEFEVIGIVLENPDAEVSAQEMVELLHVIEDHGVRVVFAEPQFNTSVLNLVADEGEIEIVTLLTDSFAEGVETYIELMRFNRDQLVRTLAE